jgi:hypothetical protein
MEDNSKRDRTFCRHSESADLDVRITYRINKSLASCFVLPSSLVISSDLSPYSHPRTSDASIHTPVPLLLSFPLTQHGHQGTLDSLAVFDVSGERGMSMLPSLAVPVR